MLLLLCLLPHSSSLEKRLRQSRHLAKGVDPTISIHHCPEQSNPKLHVETLNGSRVAIQSVLHLRCGDIVVAKIERMRFRHRHHTTRNCGVRATTHSINYAIVRAIQ